MRILYGVQGTGNGHITRARVMARELANTGIEVTFLFSGRPRQKLFDMEVFGDYLWREGLTFRTRRGRVSYLETAWRAHPLQFIRDLRSLDLSGYDLVISDFEPVTAWAAKLRGIRTIGIGHQYAFDYDIPVTGADPIARLVMRNFAPVDLGIGLHWHHFDQPILPPMIEVPPTAEDPQPDKVVVYLPFEDPTRVIELLAPLTGYRFHIYTAEPVVSDHAHIRIRPLSRDGFQKDVSECGGIISNAGFELASEALLTGKKLLVKPLHAQMEQLSNALALDRLGYGQTMHELSMPVVKHWLDHGRPVRVRFPNVAREIVAWLQQDRLRVDRAWVDQVWRQTESTDES